MDIPCWVSDVVFGLGYHLVPIDLGGIDIVADDGAGEFATDVLEENVGLQPGAEITHLDFEIGLVKNHIGLHSGIVRVDALLHVESPIFGGGAGERSHLDTVAWDGAHTFVEFDVALHQLRYSDIANNLHMTAAAVASRAVALSHAHTAYEAKHDKRTHDLLYFKGSN